MNGKVALSPGDVLEFESLYYTDWKCSICKLWQPRTTPVREIRKAAGVSLLCITHKSPDEAGEECRCHCHTDGMCEECGR